MKLLPKIILFTLTFFIIPSLIAGKNDVLASTSDGPAIEFSLEYPKNQDKGKEKGYFDLNMEPGQTQTVHIKFTNNSSETKIIKVIKANALTTQNGGIYYTEKESSEFSYSLNQNFLSSKYITVENMIELPAHSTRALPIVLQAPQEKGTYLSGILFTAEQTMNHENNENVQIDTEVRVGTAIQMNVGEHEIPEIKVKESVVEIYPSGIQIQTRVENPTSSIVKGYKLHYKVYNNKNELIFEGGTEKLDMAPFTGIMFPANWDHEKFNEGDYQIELTVEGEGKTFTKRNDFEIKKDHTVEYINTNTATDAKPIVENGNTTLIYILSGIIAVLVALIIFIIFKKRK